MEIQLQRVCVEELGQKNDVLTLMNWQNLVEVAAAALWPLITVSLFRLPSP
jgi:hypothetical protein